MRYGAAAFDALARRAAAPTARGAGRRARRTSASTRDGGNAAERSAIASQRRRSTRRAASIAQALLDGLLDDAAAPARRTPARGRCWLVSTALRSSPAATARAPRDRARPARRSRAAAAAGRGTSSADAPQAPRPSAMRAAMIDAALNRADSQPVGGEQEQRRTPIASHADARRAAPASCASGVRTCAMMPSRSVGGDGACADSRA